MPPFHLVPMVFSSFRVRTRTSRRQSCALTEDDSLLADDGDDNDGDGDDGGCDDILSLLEKYRHRADLDSASSTEEDADESLEDWWQQQQQQQQLTPTTTTTASTATAPSRPSAWQARRSSSPPPPRHEHDRDDAGRGSPRRGDDVESVASRVSLERMKVIPFVSLHLEAAKPSSSAASSSDDRDDDEQSFHWNLAVSKARDRDERFPLSPECHQQEEEEEGCTRREGLSPAPSTIASPSSCSSGRMRTIPLQSMIGSTSRKATQLLVLGRQLGSSSRHLGPAIPATVSLHRDSAQEEDSRCHSSSQILWDPARPLVFGDTAKDWLDWESHAMDRRSAFSEGCRAALAHLLADPRDGRVLALVRQMPELCLVRFRMSDSIQLLLHWCCRHLWLEGVQQCYRAIPEAIGIALDCMLPLHVAAAAVGSAARDDDSAVEVIEFLCERYPRALRQTNRKLQTPLHLAVATAAAGLNEKAILRLLEACPAAALLADEDGWTPAHHVCQNRRGPEGSAARVLSGILRCAPSSADAVTRNLEKPIHIALRNNAVDLIRVFLECEASSYHVDDDMTCGGFY